METLVIVPQIGDYYECYLGAIVEAIFFIKRETESL